MLRPRPTAALTDVADAELTSAAEAALANTPGVREVEDVRLRWIGHRIRTEAGIAEDQQLDLVTAQAIATAAHHRLLHEVPKLVDATVHVSPSADDGTDHHAVLAHHQPAVPATTERRSSPKRRLNGE